MVGAATIPIWIYGSTNLYYTEFTINAFTINDTLLNTME